MILGAASCLGDILWTLLATALLIIEGYFGVTKGFELSTIVLYNKCPICEPIAVPWGYLGLGVCLGVVMATGGWLGIGY